MEYPLDIISYFEGIRKTKINVKTGCDYTKEQMKIAVNYHPQLSNLTRKEREAIYEIIDYLVCL